jgi:hypothetical protein
MDIDPNQVVTVELNWDNDGYPETYARDLTRRQLGDLLVRIDDMAGETEVDRDADPDATAPPEIPAEDAYRFAPPLAEEVAWVTATAAYLSDMPGDEPITREYWIRKAAALDRIALQVPGPDTEQAATEAADALNVHDAIHDTTAGPIGPDMPIWKSHAHGNPRGYTRQEYPLWRRQDLTASGHCPNCGWLTYQCNCADHPDA